MNAFRVLLAKELLESRRTIRLVATLGLFVIVGIISPLTARYLPDILKASLGDQITIPIPVPSALDAVAQLQKNMGQLGALAAIILAMGSVAGEKDRGTAAFVLAMPVGRGAFLAAKLTSQGIVLAIAIAAGVIVAWVYTAVLFAPQPVLGWVALALLSWLELMVWSSITFLASTAIGSATAAAGVGFVALIGVSILGVIPAVGRFLPAGLPGPAATLASGTTTGIDGWSLATAIGGSLVLVVGSAVVAWLVFRRQEL